MNNPNFPQNGMQQNGMAPRMNNGLQQFVVHYRGQLQQGKVPQGWQQSVPPEERAALGMQFFTQYRLLKPEIGEMEAMRASVNFETQTFMSAQTKDQYVNNIKQKLIMMTGARQAQLQQMQNSMGQPANPMNPMNPAQLNMMGQAGMQRPQQNAPQQFNPAFPNPQLQRPMQISPVPNMGQGGPQAMGMNNAARPNMNQGQQPQQQNMQQSPHVINQFAKKLMETCKEEVRQKFQQEIQTWPEDKKAQLRASGVDPLFFRFRQHAEMMIKKGAINLQQLGLPSTMNQMQQNRVQNQRQPNQDFDFNAIATQQIEAMNVQAQGATVVPASNNMNGNQMNGFPGQNGQQPQQQNAALAQRQAAEAAFQNNMQRQQAAQAQAQAQAQQHAQAQLEQQRQRQQAQLRNPNQILQGLNGGLNMPPGGNQSPAMSMLNRPMLPPGQQMPSSTPQQQPQSHVPVMTPRPGQVNEQQLSTLMREAQQRANAVAQSNQPLTEHVRLSMMPQDIAPEMKAQLLKVPETQFRHILQQYMQANRRNNGLQNVPFQGAQPNQGNLFLNQQQQQQQPQQPQLPPGLQNQMLGGANMAHLGRPGLNVGQQQPGVGPQTPMGQRPQIVNQQQRLAYAQNLLRTSPGIIQATDSRIFPPNILNNQIKSSLPPDVKTWHQLKQWATANPALMNGVDVQKLLLLQVLHFQDLMSQPNKGQLGMPNPQQNGLAGASPMGQMPQNPGLIRTPQQQLNMANLPPIQVTPQDLQMYRQRLPAQSANMPEEQLRQLILQHKLKTRQQQQQQQMLNAQQPQQRPTPQAQPAVPVPQQMPNRPPTAQSQAPPQAKAPPRTQPTAQPAQANSANTVNKQGTKRPNEDAGDNAANASATNAAPQAPPMVPSKSQAGLSITQEQMSKMTPAQQAQIRAQLLKAQDPSNAANNKMQPQQRSLPNGQELKTRMADPVRQRAFKQIVDEVEKSLPPRQPIQMPAELRASVQHSLREQLDNLKKVEQALRIFHVTYDGAESEQVLRQVVKARALVFQQIDEKDGTLKDQLTLTTDEFRNNMRSMIGFVTKVMSKMRQQQSQGAGQQPQPPQVPANAPPAQLNAANLKIVEQQQRQQKAPSAPTTDRPPFALGDQAVPGIPTYFQGAKTVTNLVLPDKKRTKLDPSSQSSTPGAKASPRIGTSKGGSPELTRQQAPQKPTFRCRTAECEYSVRGFDTQAELDSHVSQMHAKIENPMQFALESMAEYLDVDQKTGEPRVDANSQKARNAKPLPVAARSSQQVKSEHTPNAQAHAATPVGGQAAATPMTRVPTQTGIKSSPAGNLLKTPQTMAKVATPSTGAPAKGTPTSMPRPLPKEPQPDTTTEAGKEEEQQPLIPMSLLDYSYEDTFAALDANGPFTVLDLKDEDTTWAVRSRPASPMATPDTSDKDTPSTRTSDISENDNLQINLDMDMPDAWALSLDGNTLPLNLQLSEDLQNLGVVLPPMDSNDMMLFPDFSGGMMDLDTLEKTMDSMDSLDPSTLGHL